MNPFSSDNIQPSEKNKTIKFTKIKLDKKHLFKDPAAIAFVLLFVLIGSYVVFKSFAASSTPLVASLYASQMNLPAGASTYNSSTFTGEKYVEMTANGSLTGSINLPSAVSSLTVNASGDQCSGAPDMTVNLDGSNVLTNYPVTSTSWVAETINLTNPLAAGTHTLGLSFTNAQSSHSCKRNLYLFITNFYGSVATTTPAPTVTLTSNPTSVSSGTTSTLTWSSTNATSCLASGAWSGTEPTSGSIVTADLTQTSTFNLACTGTGGTTNSSVTVAVAASSGSNPLALGFAVFQPESGTGPSTAFSGYQKAAGSLPDFVEWFSGWPGADPGAATTSAADPLYWGSQEQMMQADNLTPIISWGSDDLSLKAIVSGTYDNSILAPAATLAKAYPGTLYIRLDWEMNGSWAAYNPQNSAQPAGESPATYIAMWQHVVNYFRSADVTNVKWIWAPNDDNGSGTMAAFYPGDNYVDYVGLDAYNYAYTQGWSWYTPKQLMGADYTELEGITKKPVIITETSSVEANSSEASQGLSKAQWIQQLSAYLPTLSNVVGICWFNDTATVSNVSVNLGINSSTAATSAWNKYFVNNPEYQGKLPQ